MIFGVWAWDVSGLSTCTKNIFYLAKMIYVCMHAYAVSYHLPAAQDLDERGHHGGGRRGERARYCRGFCVLCRGIHVRKVRGRGEELVIVHFFLCCGIHVDG